MLGRNNEPHRHLIGNGWCEKEIEEQEYLKLFNTLVYICDEYDYWTEVIRYERDNLVFFGG